MQGNYQNNDIISNGYFNLEAGFGSINETLKNAKEQNPTINRVDVEHFRSKQLPNNRFENTGVQTPTLHPSQSWSIRLT